MAVVNLDLADIFEEAWERAGVELKSGFDLATTRRSFNILMMEWANRGLNLWTVEENTQAVTSGTATYTLSETDTVDLIEHVIRDSNSKDYQVQRFSVAMYAKQHDKALSARPTSVYVDRAAANTKITLWPTPDDDYTFVYWRLAGIDGLSSGIGSGTNADAPARFVPALVSGLAYLIAMKKNPTRAPDLKLVYDEAFQLAADMDRDRSSMYLRPSVGRRR